MAIFKCKMCGANLEVGEKVTVTECEYCGTSQTLPKLDNDRRAALYDRAGHFRRNNDFDKASALYEQILNEDVTDAEAYWSLVLCRFGIQYVEDPKTKKRIPTVNRTQRTSIFDDANYKSALEYADADQKALYESEATTINEIQKGILAISQKEEPFDVFICYKESDAEGKRTPDSVLAQELYFGLERAGFKVFFSRITLEKKLGEAYEPYIFAALQSSKVMVVMGTKPEYFNAVWVKNEWSRYLRLIDEDPSKKLIPAFKDMDAYDLPEEFSLLQAQDMSKLGFMQDLILGIEKIAGKKEEEHAAPAAGAADVVGVKQLLTRAGMCLEDGDWGRADEFCEEVLNRDPECAEAWAYKLCIDTHSRNVASLKNLKENFSNNKNYQKALRFAGTELKAKLHGILTFIDDRNEEERKQKIYAEAAQLYSRATYQRDYDAAAELFAKIPGFKDASDRVEICKKEGEIARKEAIYTQALAAYNSTTPSVILSSKQKFLSVADYKDAGELASLVEETAERARRANLCNGARGVLNSINEYAKIDRAIADMDSIAAADPDAKDLADRLRSKKQGLIDAENRKIAE
ncbi:MAG: toll/interleukin-1 receptor domain-containing protein [Clostridia bacterium]|nr:toll/interleukin-1 receptor domain-containing protein [Clostridia bacterium]